MVLYLNHCQSSPADMYPNHHHRHHPGHQNFSIAPYGYGGQQPPAVQYGSDMHGCAVAAQYQMAEQQPAPWHTPAVYMSSCARGPVPFDPDWASQGQQAGCAHGQAPPAPPPPPPPAAFAAYKQAQEQEYAAQVQVQDLTHAGHHSPDSGLTVSSDGVSSSDSPQHPNAHAQAMARPAPVRSPYEWMKTKSAFPAPHNSGHPRSSSKGLDVLLTEGGKTRTKDKYRVVYSDNQRLELEKEFHYSRYITIRRKAELAQTLGLSERQVKIWFQNRRAKERKQGKKRDELKIKQDPGMMGPEALQIPPGHAGAVCLKKLDQQQRDMEQYDSSVRPRPLGLGDMGPSYNSTTTFL